MMCLGTWKSKDTALEVQVVRFTATQVWWENPSVCVFTNSTERLAFEASMVPVSAYVEKGFIDEKDVFKHAPFGSCVRTFLRENVLWCVLSDVMRSSGAKIRDASELIRLIAPQCVRRVRIGGAYKRTEYIVANETGVSQAWAAIDGRSGRVLSDRYRPELLITPNTGREAAARKEQTNG